MEEKFYKIGSIIMIVLIAITATAFVCLVVMDHDDNNIPNNVTINNTSVNNTTDNISSVNHENNNSEDNDNHVSDESESDDYYPAGNYNVDDDYDDDFVADGDWGHEGEDYEIYE